MTNSYIKLAEELDFVSRLHISEDYPCANASLAEAARILRAAAGADVAALMAMIDDHGGHRWSTGYNEGANHVASATKNDKDAQKARAALESALRLALAAREDAVHLTAPVPSVGTTVEAFRMQVSPLLYQPNTPFTKKEVEDETMKICGCKGQYACCGCVANQALGNLYGRKNSGDPNWGKDEWAAAAPKGTP